MKKIVTLHQIKAITQLQQWADGFIIGNKRFGARLSASFDPDDINQAIAHAKSYQKEIFLMANRIFNDEDCEAFAIWLRMIDVDGLTGIIVADVGAMSVLKVLGWISKAVYHPETLLTNQYDANVFADEGIYGAFVAKEITLEEIKHIGMNRQLKLFMIGHGYLDMFYSKRQLVKTFTIKANVANTFHDHKHLTLIEAKRDQEPYPILEDDAGTHVFRYNVLHTDKHVDQLRRAIDYLVIDTLFQSDAYALEILKLYHHPNDQLRHDIIQKFKETWDEGFLFKPTVYKMKGESHD